MYAVMTTANTRTSNISTWRLVCVFQVHDGTARQLAVGAGRGHQQGAGRGLRLTQLVRGPVLEARVYTRQGGQPAQGVKVRRATSSGVEVKRATSSGGQGKTSNQLRGQGKAGNQLGGSR